MMNRETLRALLVDRELGELPPDINELLDAYIAAVPAARAEADATVRTVTVARETVRSYPDLAPKAEAGAEVQVIPMFYWVARAAALIAVAALAGWLGYGAGQSKVAGNKPAPVVQVAEHRFDGLWARYRVAYDAQRGTFVVAQQ
jgi:hypothetical protein